jgi:hypothetical protein
MIAAAARSVLAGPAAAGWLFEAQQLSCKCQTEIQRWLSQPRWQKRRPAAHWLLGLATLKALK